LGIGQPISVAVADAGRVVGLTRIERVDVGTVERAVTVGIGDVRVGTGERLRRVGQPIAVAVAGANRVVGRTNIKRVGVGAVERTVTVGIGDIWVGAGERFMRIGPL
jgi:hypothetical protein